MAYTCDAECKFDMKNKCGSYTQIAGITWTHMFPESTSLPLNACLVSFPELLVCVE
jgi:hypothetical protein